MDHADTHRVNLGVARDLVFRMQLISFTTVLLLVSGFFGHQIVAKQLLSIIVSRSAIPTPNFMNPEYFVCVLFEYFFQIKVLNQCQNTPKNANITCYIEKTHFATL